MSREVEVDKIGTKVIKEFRKNKTIPYCPEYNLITGSIKATLFVQQVIYWMNRGNCSPWVYKSAKDFKAELDFSKDDVEKVRKGLKSIGLLKEEYHRSEHRIYFLIDLNRFEELISKVESGGKIPQGRWKNSAGQVEKFHFAYTKTTTKINSESSETSSGISKEKVIEAVKRKRISKEIASPENMFRFFVQVSKDAGYVVDPTFTKQTFGITKALMSFLTQNSLDFKEFICYTVDHWKVLRTKIVWEDSKKSKLSETPSIREINMVRTSLLNTPTQIKDDSIIIERG